MESIIAKLYSLTQTNLATTPSPAPSIDDLEQALNQLTLKDITPPPPPGVPNSSPPPASPLDGDLKRLWLLDEKFEVHMKSIILCLDALASPDPSSQHKVEVNLTEEKSWLQVSIRELHGLERHRDLDIRVLAEAMRDRMAQFASAIDFYIEILQERSPPQSSPHVVNSGDFIFICAFISKYNGFFRTLF
jgi:hypothetical protein